MSYAAKADLLQSIDEAVLIQLTDDIDAGVVDDAVVEAALVEASALVDGYVGSRYALPLATTPDILRRFCVDLALCSLYERRVGLPDHWKERCKNAHRFLEQVAKGAIRLGVDDPAGTGPSDVMTVGANAPLFPRAELDRY